MKENEVLEQIGVSSKEKLYNILKENNCDYKIYKFKEKYFPLLFPKKVELKENIGRTIENDGVIQIKLFDKKACGWRVILSVNEPNKIMQQVEWTRKGKLPHIEVEKYDLDKYCLNKGHLLGKNFFDKKIIESTEYIRSNNRTTTSFASKKNSDNIYLQFQSAIIIQGEFEKSVVDCLTLNDIDFLKVYYEVQPIFLNDKDSVPIGNRIFACTNYCERFRYTTKVKKECYLPFHVFIPNVENDGNFLEKRIFYKNGKIIPLVKE